MSGPSCASLSRTHRPTAPAELAAIVDWEMGTIGDPKLDLAWLLGSWPEDTPVPEPYGPGIKDVRGLPGQSAMLACYRDLSGRHVEDFDCPVILAAFKAALILSLQRPTRTLSMDR